MIERNESVKSIDWVDMHGSDLRTPGRRHKGKLVNLLTVSHRIYRIILAEE